MHFDENNMESIGLRVADHVSAMLAYWDENLICRFVNASYMDWFGKTREEMVGKITIKELLGPIYDQNLPYILGVLAGKPQTFEREIPIPSGGTRHSIANYFPDFVNGQVRGFFVHVADITKLKLLEKNLTKSNEIIGEQNKRLLNFANIVSHNLRSYAGNLKSILNLFAEAESEEEKKVMFNYLQSISKGFSTTVNHLTEIVEIQSQTELGLEQIKVYDYVRQTIDVLRVQIDSTKSIVRNNVRRDLTLQTNPAYMESILLNLLTNAIKYRNPSKKLIVEIDAMLNAYELQLTIKDNGRGIDLEKHKNDIFSLHKTFHGNSDAKGVGLFITKLQVEALKGSIEIKSKVDEGTSFMIHFPTRRVDDA
jgi:PAS domain S-box-containing protein